MPNARPRYRCLSAPLLDLLGAKQLLLGRMVVPLMLNLQRQALRKTLAFEVQEILS